MIDDPDFTARKRPFAPVHRRSIELQQLDALLRIEEFLHQHGTAMIKVDGDGAEVVPPETFKTPKRGRK